MFNKNIKEESMSNKENKGINNESNNGIKKEKLVPVKVIKNWRGDTGMENRQWLKGSILYMKESRAKAVPQVKVITGDEYKKLEKKINEEIKQALAKGNK